MVVLSGRYRPHEILLLILSAAIGVAYTIGAPPPTSVAALLPGWTIRVWAVGLALHGVVGLVAIFSKIRRALELEAGAMLLGAAALVWYIAAVLPFGPRAYFAAGFSIAWAFANVFRAAQIRRDLKSGAP